jgi:tetratricopeptide (TPR) repeat protein
MSSSRLTQLQQMLSENPEDAFLMFAIAKEYEKLEDLEQALKYYTALRTDHANYVGTYYHLGKLYEQLKHPQQAVEVYEEGISIARQAGDHHAHQELAGARLALGDEDDWE